MRENSAHHLEATATGIPSGKLGMWLFLASEVMFFTGLLGTYIVLRAGLPHWPHPGEELSIPIAAFNTFILLSSSMTMAMAVAAVHHADLKRLRSFLGATILLGAAFLGVKGYEYSLKFAHGHYPGTGTFWDCYFMLTGFHGIHVLAGVIANAWLLSLTFRTDFLGRRGHDRCSREPAEGNGAASDSRRHDRCSREPAEGNGAASDSRSHFVEVSGLYWHFVDLVWIFLFPLLYLL